MPLVVTPSERVWGDGFEPFLQVANVPPGKIHARSGIECDHPSRALKFTREEDKNERVVKRKQAKQANIMRVNS